MKNERCHTRKRGQIILIVSLFLGATVLVITAVAGFLTITQLRQAGGIEHSARAIFAADAGAEWALCAIVNPNPADPTGGCRSGPSPNPDLAYCPQYKPVFTNGAEADVLLICSGDTPRRIISQGRMGNTVRIIEIKFGGP